MESAGPELIGYVAAALTTASFVPQVWKAWQGGRTRDISLSMYLLFSSGVALWLLYGLLVGSRPMIAANAVTLLLALIVLGLKRRHG